MTEAVEPLVRASAWPVEEVTRQPRRRRGGALWTGATIVGLWAGVAALAPVLAPHSPVDLDVMSRLEPPTLRHPFGTDEAGRDHFSRVMYGARITIPTAFTVILLAMLFGAAVGAVAGYAGGRVDELLMRIVDVVLAFPPIVLAMAITASLGAGLRNAMFAILLVSWPEFSRLTRGQVLSVRENDYVLAARGLGVPATRVLWAHVLPNAFSPVVVKATLDVGNAIVLTAALSFIGHDRRRPDEVRVLVGGDVPGAGDPLRRPGLQLPRGRSPGSAESASSARLTAPTVARPGASPCLDRQECGAYTPLSTGYARFGEG